ncbi:unnamed protein product [Bursaphelenchus xylophilus]|uniref:(pine wood nematode) hypothetical protein n=1 Tax=Bursaphelenchus xylophilus TaxID=6326 RepID=A0A1I7RPC7_BURXY|nr:unnamed protein product [Bursaphelenchus xylophilus]CAG9095797.1 unnamed protein product [Bursaphelenchus xylophilus]
MPIVIQYWKNKGIKSLLLITLKEGEEIKSDKAAARVLKFAEEELGAKIEYFHNKTLKTGQFTQTLRSFAAGTEFSWTLDPDKTVFITSDADFFPNKMESHVPKVRKGKEIMFYDHDCCGFLRHRGERFQMYIMITIGMTLRRWREIMSIPDNPLDGDWIDTYVNQTFNGVISRKSTWWQWFLDQRVFGIHMKRWKEAHEEEYSRIVDTLYRKGQPRLERFDWPADDVLAKTDVWNTYESAHLTPGIFMDHVWEKNLVFYNRIFPSDQVKKLTEYRNSVVEVMNVTETLRRHYHPEQNGAYWEKTFQITDMLGEAKKRVKSKGKREQKDDMEKKADNEGTDDKAQQEKREKLEKKQEK